MNRNAPYSVAVLAMTFAMGGSSLAMPTGGTAAGAAAPALSAAPAPGAAAADRGRAHPAAVAHHTQADLVDLDGVDALRAAFNADHGWTRLLLTFSPT